MPTSIARVVLLFVAVIDLSMENCYKFHLLTARTTDSENFKHNATICSNNTASMNFRALKAVPTLILNFQVTQSKEDYKKVIYSGKIKICEIVKFFQSVKILSDTTASLLGPDKGNLSMTCPMPEGTYVMSNVHVSPESRFLRYLYVPNSIVSVNVGMFSLLPNNKMEKLASVEINATMTRSC